MTFEIKAEIREIQERLREIEGSDGFHQRGCIPEEIEAIDKAIEYLDRAVHWTT